MSDPIPSATPDSDATDQRLPANAEDRKAAAALSSLNTNELGESGSKLPSSANQEALGKAMSRLEIAAGQEPKKKKPEAQKEEAVKKKAVRVTAEDVGLLVCCSLSYVMCGVRWVDGIDWTGLTSVGCRSISWI